MKIKVKLFALYREVMGVGEMELEGATPAHLWAALLERHPALHRHRPLIAVNGDFVPPERALREGDEVAFLPPFSGGGRVVITPETLDPQAIARSLEEEAHGALVLFQGIVRRWSEGRRVRHLEYEAYEPMASRKLEEVAGEMEARWGVAVAMHHRTGRLEVGEVALVVAVAAPHRKEAFEACMFAIDRIKEVVPIWKKEVFADGEAWAHDEGA